MSTTRRGLFGLLAGAAAIPLVKHLPKPAFNWNGYDGAFSGVSDLPNISEWAAIHTNFISNEIFATTTVFKNLYVFDHLENVE